MIPIHLTLFQLILKNRYPIFGVFIPAKISKYNKTSRQWFGSRHCWNYSRFCGHLRLKDVRGLYSSKTSLGLCLRLWDILCLDLCSELRQSFSVWTDCETGAYVCTSGNFGTDSVYAVFYKNAIFRKWYRQRTKRHWGNQAQTRSNCHNFSAWFTSHIYTFIILI